MIHKSFTDFNLDDLKKYNCELTVGDYFDRKTINFSDFKFENIDGKVLVTLNLTKDNPLYELAHKYERFTLSFINKDLFDNLKDEDIYKYLTPIYDSDSFVSYIKESQYAMKCKRVEFEGDNKIVAEIPSFLGREYEN